MPEYAFCTYNSSTGSYTGKTTLTSVRLPNSATSIGNNAFYYCSGLTSVTIPAGLTSIGSNAFAYCSGLTSVTLPAGLTNIGNYAFYYCSGLTSVTIPAGLTSIGSSAFYNCYRLTSVTLPASLTSLGSYAFQSCSGLTSVTNFSLTPQNISGNGVFSDVTTSNVRLLVLPASISAYQSAAVWNGFNIVSGYRVSTAVSPVACGSVSGAEQGIYAAGSSVTLTAIPTENSIFSRWTGGSRALGTANPLTITITQDTAITAYFLKTGNYHVAAGGLSAIPSVGDVSILTLTGAIDARDVKLMRDNMPYLTVLDLSDATIAAYTGTGGTDGANSTTYPAKGMPKSSFEGKATLTSVTLPDSLSSVGERAFHGCSGLLHLYVQRATPPVAYSSTFEGVDKFTCKLHVPTGSAALYSHASATGWKDFTNIVSPHTVTFYSNGGSTVPPQVATDGKVLRPADPTRSGYTFAGWYKETTFATEWNFVTDVVTSDLTLYAKWTQNSSGNPPIDPTGVDAQLQATVALYPNPFSSEVHLTGAAGCTLTVVTAAGAVVHTQKITGAAETIALRHLPSGVYFFTLEKEGRKAVKRMIRN
jgi:uncharacterized repeat protein (TIGR02543 family)